MKKIVLILFLFTSTIVSSQSLIDTINFNSFQKGFLNQELINFINVKRYIKGKSNLVESKSNSFIAKYHTDYFIEFKDESDIHKSAIKTILDPNSDYYFYSLFYRDTDRFYYLHHYLDEPEITSTFIGEKSVFITLQIDTKLTYKNLIDMLIDELILDENSIIFSELNGIQNYIGVSNDFLITEENEIRFMLTIVLGTEI